MKFQFVNTETDQNELFEVNGAAAAGGLGVAIICGCHFTITHTPNQLSCVAIMDPEHGEFDFELFNSDTEPPVLAPLHIASMFQRFTTERFVRWKKTKTK